MSFGQKLLIIWGLAAAMAFVVALRHQGSSAGRTASCVGGLIGVSVAAIAGALILVGMVSHTLTIHLVQIAPLLLVFVLLSWQPAWGIIAVGPLFAFWLLVMGGIWLFLLGLATVFGGTFSPTEIVLTLAIGVASAAGLLATSRRAVGVPLSVRVLVVVVFSGLQSAALWLSYEPIIAAR